MLDERAYTAVKYKDASISKVLLWERTRSWFVSIIVVAVDYIAVLSAVWTAYLIRGKVIPLFYQDFSVPRVYIFIVIPVSFLFFLHFDRLPNCNNKLN